MEELNKDTLKKALAQLPNCAPEASVWAAIDGQLQINNVTHDLKSDFNQYAPPSFIWDNLENELELNKNAQNTEGSIYELKIQELSINSPINSPIKSIKKQGLLRPLNVQKWAMAAGVAGLIFTVFSVLKPKNTEGFDLKYATEVVDNQLIKNDWNDSEADFKMVEDFCQQQIAACETPAFKTLKHELDELNTAREDIKKAIGDFNSNADLMLQLKDIEQQRITVLKQIVGVM